MRRLTAMSIRQRLGAVGVVMALAAAGVVWLWPDDEPPAPPFPEIGYVQQGTDAPHTVVHRTARPSFDEATISYADEETATWEGSLAFDDVAIGDFDGDGRHRRQIATTSQPIGTEVSSPEWLVWHVDADADDVIDLSVFRRPLAEEGAALPATQPIGFLHRPYEEYIVSRSGVGQTMASLYADGGLHPAVCQSGLFPDPGPLDPDEAITLLETEDRIIWCTRPRQAPEPLTDEATTIEAGEPSEVDEPALQGFQQPHNLTGAPSSISSPAQDSEDSDEPIEIDLPETLTETPCQQAIREHNAAEEQADRLSENADGAASAAEDRASEIFETLESLQELIEEARRIQGEAFKIADFMNRLNAAKQNGTLDDFIQSELEGFAQSKIDELKDKLKGEAIDLLLDTINNDSTPEQIRDLQRRLINGIGKPPQAVVLDILNWVKETAEDAAERIRNLGVDLDQRADEECGGPVNRFLCEHLPFGIGCSEEPPLPLPESDGPDDSGLVFPDPHLVTMDGLRYDFHGVGEYTLLRGEDLEVQVRFEWVAGWSDSTAVAVRLPGAQQAVSVYSDTADDQDGWVVYLDQDAYKIHSGQTVLGDYILTVDDGGSLQVQADGSARITVPLISCCETSVDLDEALASTLDGGLLGDFDGEPSNDYRLPDGTVIPVDEMDFDTLYDTFGDAWRVKTNEASLFAYEPGVGPSNYHNPRFPEDELTLASLTSDQLRDASTVCLDEGVWVEPRLTPCLLDVALTNDERWAERAATEQQDVSGDAVPLALPSGLWSSHGGYILWQHDDFEIRALIVGDSSVSTARLMIRALEVEANGSTTLIYPGWQDPPTSIDLPGDRQLQLALWSEQELVVALDGSLDGVTGLATEEATEPGDGGGPGTAGGPAAERRIPADAVQEWAVQFPAEED